MEFMIKVQKKELEYLEEKNKKLIDDKNGIELL